MYIKMAKEIKEIINLVQCNNFEIYVVGGYIRDKILRLKTYDVDMTTNATPNDLKIILEKYNVNDIKIRTTSTLFFVIIDLSFML